METTTEANSHSRELTATEIPLAVAEIVDRMSRLKRAHEEFFSTDWSRDEDEDSVAARLRRKHGIPEGVMIVEEFGDPARHNIQWFKTVANKWVRGKLTPEEATELYAGWDCLDEFDFCWVFMGKPSCYYDRSKDTDRDSTILEWLEIGCRKTGGFKPTKEMKKDSYWAHILGILGHKQDTAKANR